MTTEAQAHKQLKKLVDLKSLPKNKARVEIAKDVLAALKIQKIRAANGSYVYSERLPKGASYELRDQLALVQCDVCAIGAACVAVVARDNKFTVEGWLGVGGRQAAERLSEFFSTRQLSEMECAYEVTDFPIVCRLREATCCRPFVKARQFGERYAGRRDRLRAIFQNIVTNDGDFIP